VSFIFGPRRELNRNEGNGMNTKETEKMEMTFEVYLSGFLRNSEALKEFSERAGGLEAKEREVQIVHEI